MKKIIYWLLWLFSILLIIFGGLGIWLNNSNTQASMINKTQQHIMKQITPQSINQAKNKNSNFKADTTKEAKTSTVIYNRLHNKNANAIGIMSIPEIKMTNPIFNGYGDNGNYLALGACTMKPNQVMGQGNYALAGHYMQGNTVFHSLSKAQKGMYVYITNLKHIYQYQIDNVTTINKYDVGVINNITNQKTITLITCIQLNETPYRTLVQGHLTKVMSANQQNLNQYNLN